MSECDALRPVMPATAASEVSSGLSRTSLDTPWDFLLRVRRGKPGAAGIFSSNLKSRLEDFLHSDLSSHKIGFSVRVQILWPFIVRWQSPWSERAGNILKRCMYTWYKWMNGSVFFIFAMEPWYIILLLFCLNIIGSNFNQLYNSQYWWCSFSAFDFSPIAVP